MTIRLVGWMLLHAIWQGGLIAALLAAALRMLRLASAPTRYAVTLAALGATLVAPVATTTARHDPAGARTADVPAAPSALPFVAGGDMAPVRLTGPLVGMSSAYFNPRAIAGRVDGALPWIVVGWLGGVVVMALRLVGGVARTRRYARDGTESADAKVVATARTIAVRLGIRGVIRILRSTRVDVPMVVGWVAPVVVIPTGLLMGLAPAQIEMLIAHELAHIRRYDTVVNLAQRVVEALLFFHPAVWWISSRVRDERESCCDDLALAVTGHDRIAYGATLLLVEESRGTTPALVTAATGGSLLRRVRRLVDGCPDHADPAPRWIAAGIAIAAVVVAAVTTAADGTGRRASTPLQGSTAGVAALPLPTAGPVISSRSVTVGGSSPTSARRRSLIGARLHPSRRSTTMSRRSILVSAAALASASADAAAQPKPDFGGAWTLVGCSGCADSSNVAALRARRPVVPGWGADVTIRQDDVRLTVDGAPLPQPSTVYALGDLAPEHVTTGPNGHTRVRIRGSDLVYVPSRAAWHGDTLVLPVTGVSGSTSVAFTLTLFLDTRGDLTAEWAVRELRLNVSGTPVTWSTEGASAFRSRAPIRLQYRRA
jgi:beta-lactamase regulating signal transducer with metallopeptidase domain